MFKEARIKLTTWYLLIIMVISISFSMAIYRVLTLELGRVERIHRLRVEEGLPERVRALPPPGLEEELPRPLSLDPNLIAETKNRLKITLAVINLAILGASAAAGYFLAGQTLKPIEKMMIEQRRFVADASHELRTPLTAIKTEIEVVLRDKKINLSSAKKLLKSNLEEVDKLKSLTDYFLTLSRYQDPNTKLSLQTFNLIEAVNQVAEKLQPLAKEKNIKIVKNLKDITIKANKTSLIELLTILLDNAIKYSHKNSKVNIITQAKANTVIIKVKDFGIGIKASDLPYIFNRFYRADSSRSKTKVDGYGLGLSIAKSIVDLHRGKISLSSIPDKGSTFIVRLPLKNQ